jgi:hypothetical protein
MVRMDNTIPSTLRFRARPRAEFEELATIQCSKN